MRLILIDNGSGYIWGDTADIGGKILPLSGTDEECALAAARALDENLNEYERVYSFRRSAPRDTGMGYHVYRADAGGSEQVRVIDDGQDQELIEAVERDCEFVGYVEIRRGGGYEVEHYGADGSPDTNPETAGPFNTIEEARDWIKRRLGGRGFGTWSPPSENFPGEVEGWHESAEEGCGGWMIRERA
jgi:hypothetical protein